ncbi:hypothetical protein FRB97_003610 [Tulasnella sp. 331]|nr:hypothetical protein FRB98_007438 [Tulasnella sp. 332]KAG8877184.1 hypothetical protein FRB97_003610 [Tulasnella sp. 331]
MTTSQQEKYQHLTDEQVQHFLERGYVKIPKAFTKEKSDQYTEDLWIRIGYDPNDKNTWTEERLHLPRLRQESVKTFSPKAWGAICDLLGGEDRIEPRSAVWGDSFICNFGRPEDEHIDTHLIATIIGLKAYPVSLIHHPIVFLGDFFLHFLDSPEQALLVIPIFSDIIPRGGGTYINPMGISTIAKHLAAHPEGLQPGMGPGEGKFDFMERMREAGDDFVELTGEIGDVSLKEPFQFNRPKREDFSLVELKTLKALGDLDRLDFKHSVPRKRIIPAAWGVKDEKKTKELERLKAHAIKNGYPIPDICQPGYEAPLINGGL